MDTDITIVDSPEALLDIDTFVRDHLPRVCRAVAATTQDKGSATEALTVALRATLNDPWPDATGPDAVQQRLFRRAIAHLSDSHHHLSLIHI